MSDRNLIIRASSVSDILTNDRSGKKMGDTAISTIRKIAIYDFFGKKSSFSSKETAKGNYNEFESIQMLNFVKGKFYEKNEVKMVTDKFSGTCDIDDKEDDIIIDMKNAWTIDTFPFTVDEALKMIKKAGYEEQVRTYMMLYGRSNGCVCSALTTTPPHLIPPYESKELHDVEGIEPKKRITEVFFKRDLEWEEKLLKRYEEANDYYKYYINYLKTK
jgi:hypothetical protein